MTDRKLTNLAEDRARRLTEALRVNLRRRKAQGRARAASDARAPGDDTPEAAPTPPSDPPTETPWTA